MKQTNRRVFMMQVALGGTALAATQAMAQALVNEKDAQATALGYAADATKVKNAKYAAGQKSARTAPCSKVKLAMQPVVALCLQASKCPAMAGALLTPRRPKRSALSAARHLPWGCPQKASARWLFFGPQSLLQQDDGGAARDRRRP
jgi:hypothetical protein